MVIKSEKDFAEVVKNEISNQKKTITELAKHENCPTRYTFNSILKSKNSTQLVNVLAVLDALGLEMCVIRKDEGFPR